MMLEEFFVCCAHCAWAHENRGGETLTERIVKILRADWLARFEPTREQNNIGINIIFCILII